MSWFSHILDTSSSLISYKAKVTRDERLRQTYAPDVDTKPHVVIVPGACHTPYHYRLFKASLESAGYNVTVQRLLAIVEDGSAPLVDAMNKSVAAVRASVVKKIELGHDVVVIGHSAGGAVVGGALVGLAKKGSEPGVVRAIYLASFLMGPGESFFGKTQGNGPPFMELRDGFIVVPEAQDWFYHDVPDDIAENAAQHLVGCSGSLAVESMESVCWHEIPSVYIICEKDKAVPPSIAEWMIASAQVDWEILRIEASHSPFLSMPEKLAKIVRWAAGELDGEIKGVNFDLKKIEAEKASQEPGWTEKTMAEVEAM